MKHIIGRFYFQSPCFVGIRCDSRARAIVYNIVGLVLTGAVIAGVILL